MHICNIFNCRLIISQLNAAAFFVSQCRVISIGIAIKSNTCAFYIYIDDLSI